MKIALVVQRWHADLSGGAERHAFAWADLLSHSHNVTILTTTARDADSWIADPLPSGDEQVGKMQVVRFPVTLGRTRDWHRLHDHLLRDFRKSDTPHFAHWTTALQEEWVRTQGPHSEELLQHLSDHASEYDAVIFFTYLYSPTVFGSALIPRERSFFVPTLHDEPPAYLPVFGDVARRFGRILWNTEAEQALGEKLWGKLNGRTVGCPVEVEATVKTHGEAPTAAERRPYFLYSGRLDAGKGLPDLIRFFRSAAGQLPNAKLILTGNRGMRLPILDRLRGRLEYRGFVSESEKFNLMKSAVAFVMPSPVESFSISTLEAMECGTPVIVNGRNPVLREHVEESGNGWAYSDAEEFAKASLAALSLNAEARREMTDRGRAYVRSKYSSARILAILEEELARVKRKA